MFDVITIGSATLDVFVESDSANIVSVNSLKKKTEFMSFPYGAKVEIDGFSRNIGGGGINTAANFANLGLKTTTVIKLGNDEIAPVIKEKMKRDGVDISNVIQSEDNLTGFSIILVSFQGDRTVLAHRGANASISEDEIDFNVFKQAKWLYVAPLAGDTNKLLDKIADFAGKNGINLAINAGSTAIKKGEKYFNNILKTAEIVVMNKEEASMLTKIQVRPDTKDEKFSKKEIHPDVVTMLKKLHCREDSIAVITDGKYGVYCYDGKNFYHAPEFAAKVVSTLGAGDAFSSTFVAAIQKIGPDVVKALAYASVNAAAVIEKFGAQEGFLTFEQIEKRLLEHPEYEVKIVKCD